MSVPKRIQLRRTKGWRKPEGAIVVSRPTKWGNPFAYHDRMGGLVRYRPTAPEEWEFEGRISADGTRHDYFHPDGTVVVYYVRWATRAEIVELFRRTLTDPDRGMRSAYPSRAGHFAKVQHHEIRPGLAGKDLACWCPLEDADGNRVPCHADVLLAIARGEEI